MFNLVIRLEENEKEHATAMIQSDISECCDKILKVLSENVTKVYMKARK